MAPQDALDQQGAKESRAAWGELSAAMQDGVSWSGHERNRAWRNVGDGTFVDVSAIAGLDQVEDGRVALRCDWDGDGDQDLWLRSRNGPVLRYLENQRASSRIARVEVASPLRELEFTIRDEKGRERSVDLNRSPANSGYLASSTPQTEAALREGERIVGVRYSLAFGSASMRGEDLGTQFRVEKNSGLKMTGEEATLRSIQLRAGGLEEGSLPGRVVLRSPHPLPQARALGIMERGLTGSARGAARLLVVHSTTCETCEALLPEFVGALRESDPIAAALVDEAAEDESRLAEFAGTLVTSILGPGAELGLPFSLLLDPGGSVQAIYTGELDHATVVADAQRLVIQPVPAAERAALSDLDGTLEGGPRWFHYAPRSFNRLVGQLLDAGLSADAAVFREAGH